MVRWVENAWKGMEWIVVLRWNKGEGLSCVTENKSILIQEAIQLKVEGIVMAKLKTDGTWIDVRRHMIANGYA